MGTHAKLNRRLGAFSVVLFLIVAALGVRLVDFQVVKAAEIQEKSLASRSMTQTLQALRGDILDSSG
ncbi:MAG: penicillin-binding protein 2, partial [Micrococcales bacterium]|nr:penicillin-binding protein 2 [Micrococcales bacterium]